MGQCCLLIPVVFDAAHNPHGVEYFLNQCNQSDVLNQLPKPWILVFASLADKNWQNSLEKLLPNFEEIHLTQTASSRAVKPEALLQFAASEVSARGLCSHLASSDALSIGLSRATQKRGTLFILGSITLLGEAMEFFSIPVFPENTQSKK